MFFIRKTRYTWKISFLPRKKENISFENEYLLPLNILIQITKFNQLFFCFEVLRFENFNLILWLQVKKN